MLNVNSEIGTLKKVIIHRPDEGIARISPKKAEELLFDDIVHLPQMKEEHDVFRRVLQHIVGKENVLDLDIWMAAEDFSFYSQKTKACFYRLGTRNEARGIGGLFFDYCLYSQNKNDQ